MENERASSGRGVDAVTTTTCAWCFGRAVETVGVELSGGSVEVDLCGRHLEELLAGAREPSDV